MSNVLNEEKKQQVIALGQLGWALRRIEAATGVRRETAAGYLKAAGIATRPPGGWGRRKAKPAIRRHGRCRSSDGAASSAKYSSPTMAIAPRGKPGRRMSNTTSATTLPS